MLCVLWALGCGLCVECRGWVLCVVVVAVVAVVAVVVVVVRTDDLTHVALLMHQQVRLIMGTMSLWT